MSPADSAAGGGDAPGGVVADQELADDFCLSDAQADALLQGAPWRRFVVLGDSVAQGVYEPLDGYRSVSWPERVRDALARQQPRLAYLNLARRGLRTREIREQQLEQAVSFRPDLAVVLAGGNDLLVRHFDPSKVEGNLDEIVGGLTEVGADVVTGTLYRITRALELPKEFGDQLDARLSPLFELIRRVANRHQTLHIDYDQLAVCAEANLYASDFQHGSARGQAVAASGVIHRLGQKLRGPELDTPAVRWPPPASA